MPNIIIDGWMNFEIFMTLVNSYGYFGIFLVNLIGSASIIFPLPSSLFVFTSGAVLNPFLVGLSAALGCALGELTGFAIGTGGRKVMERKWEKQIKDTERMFQKYGGFWIILVFAATPLPDDVVGIVAGTLKYPLKKFVVASFIGKLILNLLLAYGGFYGLTWVSNIFASST
jgi:membrane protein YqaA with SNARE-associated domain